MTEKAVKFFVTTRCLMIDENCTGAVAQRIVKRIKEIRGLTGKHWMAL
jgi:hypothetical protein